VERRLSPRLHAVLTGEQSGYYADFGTLEQLAKSLRSVFVYDGQDSPSRNSRHGHPVKGMPGSKFFGYIQDHDQVGNRAQGDRIGAIAGIPAARVAAALVLTSPFVPLIFQGEEFAASTPFLFFADHEDEAMRRAVSEGRKREFAGFAWTGEIPDPRIRELHRSKINCRRLIRSSRKTIITPCWTGTGSCSPCAVSNPHCTAPTLRVQVNFEEMGAGSS